MSENIRLYIKCMVSRRCMQVVKQELAKQQIEYVSVDLGIVVIPTSITLQQHDRLKENLLRCGLELLEDKKSILIEKIKNAIVDMVHFADALPLVNYSDHISSKLGYDYTYLANVFSEITGITIQQFIINHKIEKVKELLSYKELNLTEISYKMNYSSVAHLSNQFKKVTGLSPSFYKQTMQKRMCNLENI